MANATVANIVVAKQSTNPRDIEIAKEIARQIRECDITCLGAINCWEHNRFPIEYGVIMKRVIVKQMTRATYGNIEIVLNELGYYDIVGYSIDQFGQPKKVLFEYSNVFVSDVWNLLRKIWE